MEEYGTIRIKLDELIEKAGISKNKLSHKAEMQRTQINAYCNNRDLNEPEHPHGQLLKKEVQKRRKKQKPDICAGIPVLVHHQRKQAFCKSFYPCFAAGEEYERDQK